MLATDNMEETYFVLPKRAWIYANLEIVRVPNDLERDGPNIHFQTRPHPRRAMQCVGEHTRDIHQVSGHSALWEM